MRCRDSVEWLGSRIVGKRVLYIGTVDDQPGNAAKHPPIHRALTRKARAVTGLYRAELQAGQLRDEGLQTVVADPEAFSLGTRFDTIVVPDTIEHLSNPGLFLATLDRHLEPSGEILVTTPNPAGLVRILEVLGRGKAKVNPAHVCWYTGAVLDELARRAGLRVIDEVPIDDMHKYHRPGSRPMGAGRRLASRALILMNRGICRLLPQLSETWGFVLAKTPPPEAG